MLYKTNLCKFYAKGTCKRGARCSWAHGDTDVRPFPAFFKTRMCYNWLYFGSCDRQPCTYAHSQEELRGSGKALRLCNYFFREGCCPKGLRCPMAHDVSQLDPAIKNLSHSHGVSHPRNLQQLPISVSKIFPSNAATSLDDAAANSLKLVVTPDNERDRSSDVGVPCGARAAACISSSSNTNFDSKGSGAIVPVVASTCIRDGASRCADAAASGENLDGSFWCTESGNIAASAAAAALVKDHVAAPVVPAGKADDKADSLEKGDQCVDCVLRTGAPNSNSNFEQKSDRKSANSRCTNTSNTTISSRKHTVRPVLVEPIAIAPRSATVSEQKHQKCRIGNSAAAGRIDSAPAKPSSTASSSTVTVTASQTVLGAQISRSNREKNHLRKPHGIFPSDVSTTIVAASPLAACQNQARRGRVKQREAQRPPQMHFHLGKQVNLQEDQLQKHRGGREALATAAGVPNVYDEGKLSDATTYTAQHSGTAGPISPNGRLQRQHPVEQQQLVISPWQPVRHFMQHDSPSIYHSALYPSGRHQSGEVAMKRCTSITRSCTATTTARFVSHFVTENASSNYRSNPSCLMLQHQHRLSEPRQRLKECPTTNSTVQQQVCVSGDMPALDASGDDATDTDLAQVRRDYNAPDIFTIPEKAFYDDSAAEALVSKQPSRSYFAASQFDRPFLPLPASHSFVSELGSSTCINSNVDGNICLQGSAAGEDFTATGHSFSRNSGSKCVSSPKENGMHSLEQQSVLSKSPTDEIFRLKASIIAEDSEILNSDARFSLPSYELGANSLLPVAAAAASANTYNLRPIAADGAADKLDHRLYANTLDSSDGARLGKQGNVSYASPGKVPSVAVAAGLCSSAELKKGRHDTNGLAYSSSALAQRPQTILKRCSVNPSCGSFDSSAVGVASSDYKNDEILPADACGGQSAAYQNLKCLQFSPEECSVFSSSLLFNQAAGEWLQGNGSSESSSFITDCLKTQSMGSSVALQSYKKTNEVVVKATAAERASTQPAEDIIQQKSPYDEEKFAFQQPSEQLSWQGEAEIFFLNTSSRENVASTLLGDSCEQPAEYTRTAEEAVASAELPKQSFLFRSFPLSGTAAASEAANPNWLWSGVLQQQQHQQSRESDKFRGLDGPSSDPTEYLKEGAAVSSTRAARISGAVELKSAWEIPAYNGWATTAADLLLHPAEVSSSRGCINDKDPLLFSHSFRKPRENQQGSQHGMVKTCTSSIDKKFIAESASDPFEDLWALLEGRRQNRAGQNSSGDLLLLDRAVSCDSNNAPKEVITEFLFSEPNKQNADNGHFHTLFNPLHNDLVLEVREQFGKSCSRRRGSDGSVQGGPVTDNAADDSDSSGNRSKTFAGGLLHIRPLTASSRGIGLLEDIGENETVSPRTAAEEDYAVSSKKSSRTTLADLAVDDSFAKQVTSAECASVNQSDEVNLTNVLSPHSAPICMEFLSIAVEQDLSRLRGKSLACEYGNNKVVAAINPSSCNERETITGRNASIRDSHLVSNSNSDHRGILIPNELRTDDTAGNGACDEESELAADAAAGATTTHSFLEQSINLVKDSTNEERAEGAAEHCSDTTAISGCTWEEESSSTEVPAMHAGISESFICCSPSRNNSSYNGTCSASLGTNSSAGGDVERSRWSGTPFKYQGRFLVSSSSSSNTSSSNTCNCVESSP